MALPLLEDTLKRLQERHKLTLTGTNSLNGWQMEKTADDHGTICTRPVPGTPLTGVRVRTGAAEAILVHLIRRFHCEVEALRDGDVIGWRPPTEVRDWLPESNQASGTAVQIRRGARFFAPQLVAIRRIVTDFDGLVSWGGDHNPADESLFTIAAEPGDPRLPFSGSQRRGTGPIARTSARACQ